MLFFSFELLPFEDLFDAELSHFLSISFSLTVSRFTRLKLPIPTEDRPARLDIDFPKPPLTFSNPINLDLIDSIFFFSLASLFVLLEFLILLSGVLGIDEICGVSEASMS